MRAIVQDEYGPPDNVLILRDFSTLGCQRLGSRAGRSCRMFHTATTNGSFESSPIIAQ
jgi:hypothetical protein